MLSFPSSQQTLLIDPSSLSRSLSLSLSPANPQIPSQPSDCLASLSGILCIHCSGAGGIVEAKVQWGQKPLPFARSLRIPMDRGAWQAIVHGIAKSQT